MKSNLIILISIFVLLVGCNTRDCDCEIEDEMIALNDSLVNSILTRPENWFETYWERFEEPMIKDDVKESYRLAITVLLADYFKVYRIENSNGKYNLHIKEYAISTTTSYRKDSLVNGYSKEISKSEWNNITRSIEENCYWTMPVDIEEDDGWLDGSGWTLEGFNQKNKCSKSAYHFIYRHSPYGTNDTSKFIKICENFLKLDSLVIENY